MTTARSQLAGIAVLQGIARQQAAWRAAREVLAEADAITCHACNGRVGPCTCGRGCECRHPEKVHRHYRDGTDCFRCGKQACARYRPVRRKFRIIFWR